MAKRTTPEKVQAVLLEEYDPDLPLNAALDTANAMTDALQAYDLTQSSVMTASLLERVECFLGAHYYQLGDPGYQSRNTAGASGQFNGQTGMGFAGTRFGQAAMALDLSGFLAKRDKEVADGAIRKADMFWGGTDCE